jgi:hypothetical protein
MFWLRKAIVSTANPFEEDFVDEDVQVVQDGEETNQTSQT